MALGRKTGGRPIGSKNKSTLAREAEAAAAAVAADDAPRAVPALSKIMKHFLDRADGEAAKEGGGDPAIITCGATCPVSAAEALRRQSRWRRGKSAPQRAGARPIPAVGRTAFDAAADPGGAGGACAPTGWSALGCVERRPWSWLPPARKSLPAGFWRRGGPRQER
jgi:hypothetical protein